MDHVRGAPYHPVTQDVIERRHHNLKNRLLLEHYYLLGHLEARIDTFVCHYSHCRYLESHGGLTPADVDFGRCQTIRLKRERIYRKTFERRHSQHQRQAA